MSVLCSLQLSIAPIMWHILKLEITSGTNKYRGGQSFVSDYIRPVSPLATQPSAFDKVIQVNSFNIDYRPDGQVAQFYR
eukprot:1143104-Pelagomonas_calceolata.AAC.2